MSKDSGAPSMDEFGRCEGPFLGAHEGGSLLDSNSLECTSFWEFIVKTCFPLVPVWMKRSVYAITMLARTLIVGHFVHLVFFGNISDWKNEGTPSWVLNVLQQVGSAQVRAEAKAWPPPTLVVLALLTVVTLVVHPDGLTWILLRKVESGVISVMKAILESWQVWITDFGILPSLVAAIAITGLILLVYVMIRSSTSSRRTRRCSPNPDKKKKKRKGHVRHRSGKSKSTPSSPLRSRSTSIDPSADLSDERHLSTHGENAPDLAPLTPVSAQKLLVASDEPTPRNDVRHLDDFPEGALGTWPSTARTNSNSFTVEKELSGRTWVPSVSTVDTAAMSDDLSCSSKSILSVPSLGAGSTKSASSSTVSSFPTISSNEWKLGKGSHGMVLRHSKRGRNSTQMGTAAPMPGECPSRWDALKPSHSQKNHSHQHDPQTQAKTSEKLRQRQVGPHRSHSRKIGRNGASGPKGITMGPQPPANRIPSGSSNDRFAAQSSLASPILDGMVGIFAPPPPGLGPITVGMIPRQQSGTIFPTQRPVLSASTVVLPSTQGSNLPTSSWELAAPTPPGTEANVLTFPPPRKDQYLQGLTDPSTFATNSRSNDTFATTSPARFGSGAHFPESLSRVFGTSVGSVKENPFAPDSRDSEEQIEADLQALGGQMAGSILDF